MKIKRVVLSIILCLVLVPGLFVFTACGDDESYSLSNLYTEYSNLVNKHQYLSTNEDNEIVFNYDEITYQNNQYFSNALLTEPYINLTRFYNPLLNNSLSSFSSYVENCSTDRLIVPAEDRNSLKTALDEFDSALTTTYNQTINMADLLRTGTDIESNVHMIRLSNLFESYENLYVKAFNLSHELSNIYFNYAITDANPNYSEQTLEQFDASRVVVNLRSRIENQIVNLTQSYIEQNVRGLKLYSSFTTKENGSYTSIPTSFSSYLSDIQSIDVEFSSSLGQTINTNPTKKDNFYHTSIELYNIQESLNNLLDAYRVACNEIVYTSIISDSNATDYQKTCAKIISDYSSLIDQNTTALQNALAILTENI